MGGMVHDTSQQGTTIQPSPRPPAQRQAAGRAVGLYRQAALSPVNRKTARIEGGKVPPNHEAPDAARLGPALNSALAAAQGHVSQFTPPTHQPDSEKTDRQN